MKLDKRIKSLSDILAGCGSGIKKANEFLGEKGYFAGDLYCFTDLQKCPYGTLANVFDDNDYTFQMREEEDNYYPYFIPECSLKPKEEQVKLELQSPLWIDARIPKNIIVPYDFINTIKEKFKNDITDYSQECEGTFKIKDGKVTELNLTGVALIPRSKDGVKEMAKEELEKENERLREQNKELETRYNLKCFELELLKSQLGMGPCDLTKFCKKGFKD